MLIQFYKFINHLKTSPARKNRLIITFFIIGLFLNLAIWALILFKLRPHIINLPEDKTFIPLHYNIYLGIDLFGPWQKIFNLPIIGGVILILNSLLTSLIYNKKELVSYFLITSSAFIQLILLVATTLIVLINI